MSQGARLRLTPTVSSLQQLNSAQDTPLGQGSALQRSNSYLLRTPSETPGGLTSFGTLSDSESDSGEHQSWVESIPSSDVGTDPQAEDIHEDVLQQPSPVAVNPGLPAASLADGIEKRSTSNLSKSRPSSAVDRQMFEGQDFFEGNVNRLVLAEEFCRRRLQNMYQTQLKESSFTSSYPAQLQQWWQKCLLLAEVEVANRIQSRMIEIAKTCVV